MSDKKKRKPRRRPRVRKVDPIERAVDDLLASIRAPLVENIRSLVDIGARNQLENLLDAIQKRVVSIT